MLSVSIPISYMPKTINFIFLTKRGHTHLLETTRCDFSLLDVLASRRPDPPSVRPLASRLPLSGRELEVSCLAPIVATYIFPVSSNATPMVSTTTFRWLSRRYSCQCQATPLPPFRRLSLSFGKPSADSKRRYAHLPSAKLWGIPPSQLQALRRWSPRHSVSWH